MLCSMLRKIEPRPSHFQTPLGGGEGDGWKVMTRFAGIRLGSGSNKTPKPPLISFWTTPQLRNSTVQFRDCTTRCVRSDPSGVASR